VSLQKDTAAHPSTVASSCGKYFRTTGTTWVSKKSESGFDMWLSHSVHHMRLGCEVCSRFKSKFHPEVVVFETVHDRDDPDVVLGAELLKANPDLFEVFLGGLKIWQKRFDRENNEEALSGESVQQKVRELHRVKLCPADNAPVLAINQLGKSHCHFKLFVKFSISKQNQESPLPYNSDEFIELPVDVMAFSVMLRHINVLRVISRGACPKASEPL
jgi:hypothetical protein